MITVVSDRSAFQMDSFDQRQNAMIGEAQEHNELLQELCRTDMEYEYVLHTLFYKKRQASDLLSKNPSWLNFVKRIQSPSNWIEGGFWNVAHNVSQSLWE